jgi:hypothetical protein
MPSEFPRLYTPAELEAIANSVLLGELASSHVERLQKAVGQYQWATLVDDGIFPGSTNKGRRKLLKRIIELCEQGASSEEIEAELVKLDAVTSQWLDVADRQQLRRSAEAALRKLPKSGPDPKRARRQYICDLARIFLRITGKRPGRSVHDQEGGLFRAFVKAALRPFNAEQGCEADMAVVLNRLKKGSTRKTAKN